MKQLLNDDNTQRKDLSIMINNLTQSLKSAIKSIDFNKIQHGRNKIKQKQLDQFAKINYSENAEKEEAKLKKKIQKLNDQIEDRLICSAIFSSISEILEIMKTAMEVQSNVDKQIQSGLHQLVLNLKQLPKCTKFARKLFNLMDHFNSIIIQLMLCKDIVNVEVEDQRQFQERVQKWKIEIAQIKQEQRELKKQNKQEKHQQYLQKQKEKQKNVKKKKNTKINKVLMFVTIINNKSKQLQDMEFSKLNDSSDSSLEFERIEAPQLQGRFQQQNPNQFDNCPQEKNEFLCELNDQQNLNESILLIEKLNQRQLQLIHQEKEQQYKLCSDYLQKKAQNNSEQKINELKELENNYNYMESIIIVEKFKQNQVQKFNKEVQKLQINENDDVYSNFMESIILVEKYNQKNLQKGKQELEEKDSWKLKQDILQQNKYNNLNE